MAGDITNINPEMPYDLRQTYAMNLLTPILIGVEEARRKNDFREWYNLLTMSLHTNVYQKLDDELRKEYDRLHEELLQTISCVELRNCFAGRDKDPIKIYKVQKALKELEIWLRDKMQKSGLFGSSFYGNMDDDGL
jgi:hypothetical protein